MKIKFPFISPQTFWGVLSVIPGIKEQSTWKKNAIHQSAIVSE